MLLHIAAFQAAAA